MPTLDNDIGRMTKGIRDNAKDIIDIWTMEQSRRPEFGRMELRDLREAVLGLYVILGDIEKMHQGGTPDDIERRLLSHRAFIRMDINRSSMEAERG
jgi:hypothetical protein